MSNRNYLIDPNVFSHRGTISEDDLRARLIRDAFEQAGWLDAEGNPLKGCTATITRGESRKGGYTVEVRRDLRLSDQPRLTAPNGGA